jgi:mRNA interferase HigB
MAVGGRACSSFHARPSDLLADLGRGSARAGKAWLRETKKAQWDSANALKQKYRSASILKGGRVVFNICGNKFRLVVGVNYSAKVVYVKWVGTHAEYGDIDAEEV